MIVLTLNTNIAYCYSSSRMCRGDMYGFTSMKIYTEIYTGIKLEYINKRTVILCKYGHWLSFLAMENFWRKSFVATYILFVTYICTVYTV